MIGGPTYRKLLRRGLISEDGNATNTTVATYEHRPVPTYTVDPGIDPDIIRYIYQFLPLYDILNGQLVNSYMATVISHGFHLYGPSFRRYGWKTISRMMDVLKRYEGIMDPKDISHIIYNNRRGRGHKMPYRAVANSICSEMGPSSISYDVLDKQIRRELGVSLMGFAHKHGIYTNWRNVKDSIELTPRHHQLHTRFYHEPSELYLENLIGKLRKDMISDREVVILYKMTSNDPDAKRAIIKFDQVDDIKCDLRALLL